MTLRTRLGALLSRRSASAVNIPPHIAIQTKATFWCGTMFCGHPTKAEAVGCWDLHCRQVAEENQAKEESMKGIGNHEKYWIVIGQTASPYPVKHHSLEAARIEAQRLARTHKQQIFTVFEAVEESYANDVVTVRLGDGELQIPF